MQASSRRRLFVPPNRNRRSTSPGAPIDHLRFRDGEATADDQWNDILGVLKVQAPTLDLKYLRQVAHTLNISGLLEQALIDSGIREP